MLKPLKVMIITILLITFLEGRKHDAGMLRDSHVLDDLELHAYSPTGQVMCVYGDPAYPQHEIAYLRIFKIFVEMRKFRVCSLRIDSQCVTDA